MKSIPWLEYIFMMCHKMGFPPISIIGLGRTSVSSAKRVSQAARQQYRSHLCSPFNQIENGKYS